MNDHRAMSLVQQWEVVVDDHGTERLVARWVPTERHEARRLHAA